MADTVRTIDDFLNASTGLFKDNTAGDISAQDLRDFVVSVPAQWPHANVLINGGFDFAQRQAPGTLTAITTDKYSADRWRISRETASLQYARIDTNGSLETGLTGRYYGQFKQITSAGKFAIYQPVEAINTFPLASRVVSFQCKLKASSSKTIRLGLVQLNSSGTVDTINATVVPTWGSNSTDPTLATNHARLTPSAAISNGSVSGDGISSSVTTSWQQFGGVFTMPSNAKNIIPMIWTDSQFSADDSLYVAEAGLYDGSALRAWLPRDTQHELLLCQRYCESYAGDGAVQEFPTASYIRTSTSIFSGPLSIKLRSTPTFSSNITGWTGGAPTTTTVAAYDRISDAYVTISGALTVTSSAVKGLAELRLTAGASFSGTARDRVSFFFGPDVRAIWDSEL